MEMDDPDSFPSLELKRSRLIYRIGLSVVSLVLPWFVVKAAQATLPLSWSISPAGYVVAWCVMAAACLVAISKLISLIDFEKPILVVDKNALSFCWPSTKVLPWSSILKIKFYESGRYRQTKTVIVDLAGGTQARFCLNGIEGESARNVFDRIKDYHREFGPKTVQPAADYDSSAWTGIEDD
ncbi:hypothetical protein [Pararhizobium arenae]|uniref:hypothetical protein n=1 Tax=Pararhizobium arenae TaxID=1856850 RepID=UPI00117B7EEE|nr:hypothetical protein [Pararhizobium arenae]